MLNETSHEHEERISKRDVLKGWAKYYLSAEVCSGFERLTAPAFSFGMGGILAKIYKNNPEEYKKALKRHLMFFNSEATWGSMVFGIACALEQERAKLLEAGNHQELDASAQMIPNLKVGLMGPLAGIGDTVNHGMIRPLLLSAFIPLAASGAWIAGAAPLLLWVVCITAFAYTMMNLGYTSGRKSVVRILASGELNRFIQGASVLGLFMMGALSSSYIKLATKVRWTSALGDPVALQSYLDMLFPKLLPLLAVLAIYWYFKKKGPRYITVLFSILALSLVLSYFGIV